MTTAVLTRTTLAVACTVLLLTACGGGDKAKTATQAAARVNDGEITVHQINQVLEQQRNLRPDQVDAASRQALERLIEQELAVQQATENKLDREPRVVAALEAARREILARAYLEKSAQSASKPSEDEIKAYYNAHPGLFANRKIYSLVEINVLAAPEALAEVEQQAKAAASPQAFMAWAQGKGLSVQANEARQPAEALPLQAVEAVAATPVGKALVSPVPQGLKVVFVTAAQPAPATLDQARAAIELFISNDRKRTLAEAEVKRLRAAAKIEYLGKFAGGPAAAASGAAPASEAAPAAPAAAPTPAAPAASSGLSNDALKKGLGLK